MSWIPVISSLVASAMRVEFSLDGGLPSKYWLNIGLARISLM